jgi:hypothetical protein
MAIEQQMSAPQKPVPREPAASLPEAPKMAQVERSQMPMANYEDQFQQAFMTSLNDRKAMLDKLKAKYAQEEANTPQGLAALNLKPFMTFADQLTGQKTAQSYDGNEAVALNRANKEKLQAAMMQQSDKLSDDQLGYLKAKAQEAMFAQRQAASAAKGDSTDERNLRSLYFQNPAVKGFNDIDAAYKSIVSNDATSGPAQQAFVFQFTKLLDPGSVVRETEYATSAANAGKINQMYQLAQSWSEGKPLTPKQISDMKAVANSIMQSYRKKVDSVNREFTSVARNKGLDPRNIVIDTYQGSQVADPNAEALAWLKANPNHPKAAAVRQKLGVR